MSSSIFCTRSYRNLLLLVVLAVPLPVFGQVLVVEPNCGVEGAPFRILGSGWAEPIPVCDYLFYWDGVEFAPSQPDGLFGPPDSDTVGGVTVPAGSAVGDHEVCVELRLTSDGSLLQCRKTTFKVVAEIEDPWSSGNVGTGGITLTFDPENVCDVTPCTEIVMIQVIRQRGFDTSLTPPAFRDLTFFEQGFSGHAVLDARVTPNTSASPGYTVDQNHKLNVPYYACDGPTAAQGDDTEGGGFGDYGHQGGDQALGAHGQNRARGSDEAILKDVPRRGSFPTNINQVRLEFEVNAFCASGQNQGEWVGKTTWTWSKEATTFPSIFGTVSDIVQDRTQPSAEFMLAVNLYDEKVTPWTLPTEVPPTELADPCPEGCN